jgi:two-component system, OmpR family, response regulator
VIVRALVVEDERKMAALLRRGLVEEGYAADVSRTGRDAIEMARQSEYDVIVLDLMLPDLDGLGVCRALRDGGVWTPILMLTARDRVQDRVAGLDAGADDYLVKPFSFAELLARLRALARRAQPERPAVLQAGSLRLDPATREVWRSGVQVDLSAKEFTLLETFMRRPGQVLSRLELLEHAWDAGYRGRSNVVDVYVGYLRAKIDQPFGHSSIETVRGAGYRLCPDPGE